MRMQLDRRNFFRVTARCLVGSCVLRRLEAKEDSLTVPIRREAVESRSIASIGFHTESRVLEIEFRSGALYRYLAVPRSIFEGIRQAESKGRYFNQNIRDHFEFHRLADVTQ